VQPRLGRMVGGDPARVEEAQRELAHGNRWPVVGMIAVLWLTGLGLVLRGGDVWWWAGVLAKVALLAAATGLFWWVSWRGWPRRVFALPDELPALQRRFRTVAIAMFGLVGAAFVIGMVLGNG
jgi:Flp pilus assembly protein TadB